MKTHESLFQRACKVIPGGVNSPVRAFNGVGGTPVYVESGKGSKIKTADGRSLTDFCCSWGAMILGHANDEIVEAIHAQASKGTTFGINTELEVCFAEKLCSLVPTLERVRLVSSGTEAVMTALRIARGVTGRKRIVKFDGCYHGHSDSVLVSDRCGALLIFDEVIDGFRFNLSSYAKIAGVKPDLITLGKIIGGGLPLAAVGGSAVFMDELAPRGKIYQAGTLSGNPLAVVAGLKTIEILERDDPYPRLAQLGQRVAEIINTAAASKGLPLHCAQYGGVFTVFFTGQPVKNLEDAKRCDTQAYAQHFHAMLKRGYYLPPSQFEVGFISAAHSEEEVTAFAHAVVGE